MTGDLRTPVEIAALSRGTSDDTIHALVRRELEAFAAETGERIRRVLDVGCGTGRLAVSLDGVFDEYVGCDLVRYGDFPEGQNRSFVATDLNVPPYPIADACFDGVLAVEVIEHLENPRAFVRELARVVRPGGFVLVTTPNQLSWLSHITLLLKGEFNAFQQAKGLYPAHITALLPSDLLKISRECGFADARLRYSDRGRIPLTSRHWPARLGFAGRWFSDNVLVAARAAKA